jgi:hypothetical protein
MSPKFTALVVGHVVIDNVAANSVQQIESDLLAETHPPTPRNLVMWFNRVASMLADTIKICESVKRSSTPVA